LISGWQKDCDFIDPWCGSGTLPIEAALLAYNIPPQINRRSFAFMKWQDFDKKLWEDVLENARENQTTFEHSIIGYDKDFKATRISQHNILSAQQEGKIVIERKKFEKLESPEQASLFMINPPYDERLPLEDAEAFFKALGDRMKSHFPGHTFWIISPNNQLLKSIGLRASKKAILFNGPIECRFQKFELYEGSKKDEPTDETSDEQ